MEFWDAVKKVTESYPQSEWNWAHWLSVIDLANVPCYHPVRYRLCVGDWGIPGAMLVSDKRFLDAPQWMQKAQRTCRPGEEFMTYCPVCRTFCPSPPVDVRRRREKLLAAVLLAVTETAEDEFPEG